MQRAPWQGPRRAYYFKLTLSQGAIHPLGLQVVSVPDLLTAAAAGLHHHADAGQLEGLGTRLGHLRDTLQSFASLK